MDDYEQKMIKRRRIAAGILAGLLLIAFGVSAWLLAKAYAGSAAANPLPTADPSGASDSGVLSNPLIVGLLIAAGVIALALIVLIIIRKPKTPKGKEEEKPEE